MSQSLPNQVNDFNMKNLLKAALAATVSQSLPNQVNDFNSNGGRGDAPSDDEVAIPSKPGQRLQSSQGGSGSPCGQNVAIPSKPGQRLQYGPVDPG